MLTRFGVRNFKSFRDATLRLSPLTVLIGANASGKSNLLEAIQLFSWLAAGRRFDEVLSAVRDRELALRGAPASLFRFGQSSLSVLAEVEHGGVDEPLRRFRYETALVVEKGRERLQAESLKELLDDLQHTVYRTGTRQARSDFLPIRVSDFASGRLRAAHPIRDDRLALSQVDMFPEDAAERVRDVLAGITFVDPVPRLMRGYAFRVETTLKGDAANISAVIAELCARGQRDEVLRFVGAFPEQTITDITFIETARAEVMVQLSETFGRTERPVEAALLSDGTLRALAVAAAVLSVPEATTLVIEEIDNGVHPTRAAALLENLLRVARQRRLHVVLTTHNPALLDALPDETLPDVQVCFRDPKDGCSRVVTLGEMESYPALISQDHLGQLVSRGVLDRALKRPRQRRDAASAWFAGLGRGGAP